MNLFSDILVAKKMVELIVFPFFWESKDYSMDNLQHAAFYENDH